jgi:nucleotide-binding universal stress UspA family protein
MYHRILVPLDGTRFGEHALPYAVDIAIRTGATLELVHVHHHQEHEPQLARLPQYRYQRIDQVDAEHDVAELSAEAAYLDQRATDIELRYPVRVVTRIVAGRTADAVVQEAQDIVADLIVMATHARQGLDRMRMGHLAHELVCALNVPALCIRPESDDTPIIAPELHRVLIPLDGSAFSEQVLDAAAPLLMQLQAQPTLLHILSPRPMLSSGVQEKRVIATRPQALDYLKDVAERFRGRIPAPILTALEDAQPPTSSRACSRWASTTWSPWRRTAAAASRGCSWAASRRRCCGTWTGRSCCTGRASSGRRARMRSRRRSGFTGSSGGGLR